MATVNAVVERGCSMLVHFDRAASSSEIREALESGGPEAKAEAMKKAIAILLSGEQMPQIFITIVRFVLPSDDKYVQKLLLNLDAKEWSSIFINYSAQTTANQAQDIVDGKLDKRTNTFTDFVDVAKGLIDLGYSAKGRISISGGSAGGELMGAVINSDPDLWGAVVAHVPFVDVLNTMLDETLPLTPGEWPEWGNPIEDEAAFRTIQSYDPYTHVSAQDYPPLMVTAGLNDPRVTYWEPAKWVAKLRATKTDKNILLLKTNMGAGHGGKSGRFESLHETAEEFAFILWQLGVEG